MKPTLADLSPAEDHGQALQLLQAVGALPDGIRTTTVLGAPLSKSRPERSRSGTSYVPVAERAAEDRVTRHLREIFPEPYPGNVAMACVFYRPTFQRIDVDNMLKLVCDAATGILWHDDSQVTALVGIAHLDADTPRTVIAVGHHVSTLARGTDATYPCEVCQEPISRLGRTKMPKTCSPKCAAEARGFNLLEGPALCAHCGEGFKPRSSYTKFCSVECRAARFRGLRKAVALPPVTCWECGAALSHRRGGRCRDCWRANPKAVRR